MVTENPYSTLEAFLTWRRKQLQQLPNDNAQLITSVHHSIASDVIAKPYITNQLNGKGSNVNKSVVHLVKSKACVLCIEDLSLLLALLGVCHSMGPQ